MKQRSLLVQHPGRTLLVQDLRLGLRLAAVMLVCLLAGCQTAPMQQTEWEAKVKSELPVLGHRNWLVIADSAYPAQVSAGVQTVYTGAQQLEVVKGTLEALAATKHVRPVIYLDAELSLVPENLAPGVGEYRKSLEQLLQGKQVSRLPHDQLIAKLDEAGKTFRVLLLKTDLTIPYTSVFMELDCGYWSPEAEQKLRAAMAK